MDRVNHILDQEPSDDRNPPSEPAALRIFFDEGHVDLCDEEARSFRYWYRQVARNISPHHDMFGRELIAPDEQVRKAVEALVFKINHHAHEVPEIRRLAREVKGLVAKFISGELAAVSVREFERRVTHIQADEQSEWPTSAYSP
jgi:hypothetical protein